MMRALILLTALLATTANAASLTCGNDRIMTGDSRLSVEEACGEPKARYEQVNDEGATIGWRYVYGGGYGAADRSVVFRRGKVVRIRRND